MKFMIEDPTRVSIRSCYAGDIVMFGAEYYLCLGTGEGNSLLKPVQENFVVLANLTCGDMVTLHVDDMVRKVDNVVLTGEYEAFQGE